MPGTRTLQLSTHGVLEMQGWLPCCCQVQLVCPVNAFTLPAIRGWVLQRVCRTLWPSMFRPKAWPCRHKGGQLLTPHVPILMRFLLLACLKEKLCALQRGSAAL